MTRTARSSESGVAQVEGLARRYPSLVVLARAGWLAKGVVNGLVGILAFLIASRSGDGGTGETGDEASTSGAIAKIAESTGGSLVLWLVAAGLGLYVLWRVVSILLPAERSPKTWATRAGYAVSRVHLRRLGLERGFSSPVLRLARGRRRTLASSGSPAI